MQIAAESRAEKKNYHLAHIYDEMCRRKWAERAFRGMSFFAPFGAVCLCFVTTLRRPRLQCQRVC